MLFIYRPVPDSKVLSFLPQPQAKTQHTFNNGSELSSNKSSLSSSSLSYRSDSSVTNNNNNNNNYTESELERMKHCGNLFERRNAVNKLLLNEFFRKEPCLYNQLIYKNSARIFNCLKADLNENPILKSLKLQRAKEAGDSYVEANNVTEVPKITYDSSQEKRNTLQLAFSTLKFQKVLEDLIEEVQFYGKNPDLKDDQSLVCTVLFDYMTRKFQLRDRLLDEPFDNHDQLITQIETTIHNNKTDLAAELAKNRIKADALTLDDLLPTEVREVDQHKAELPLYCWINPLKISAQDLIQFLVEEEHLKIASSKASLEKKCFMIDPHCSNVIMFHFALRPRILNHDLVKTFKLIVQDKSSCLAPHTVIKLLSKKDDVIITNISGGLLAAFIGCMMEEFEGRVFVYGATNEDKYQEVAAKLQLIGCSKYVKLMREEFNAAKYDESKLENVKVILVNAPCSKSALMNPMEFLFEEGEDVKHLRDYTLDANKPSKIKKCIQDETALLRHALRFPRVRAIIYQTYSKNSSENEQIIHRTVEDFNETRKFPIFPYKITPPVIPLTAEDIQNDEVVKDFKFLQFKPSNRMNGCFIALLTRDRDAKLDFNARKAEIQHEKKAKLSAPEPATFQEKNFLHLEEKKSKKSAPDITPSSRSKSPKKNPSKKKPKQVLISNLEDEINRLTVQQDHKPTNINLDRSESNIKAKILISKASTESSAAGIQSSSSLMFNADRRTSFDKLSQIGKLDPYRFDIAAPKRSSTPTETNSESKLEPYLNQYPFRLTKGITCFPKATTTILTTPPLIRNKTIDTNFVKQRTSKSSLPKQGKPESLSNLSNYLSSRPLSERKLKKMSQYDPNNNDRLSIYLENSVLTEAHSIAESDMNNLCLEEDLDKTKIEPEKYSIELDKPHLEAIESKIKKKQSNQKEQSSSDNYNANNLETNISQKDSEIHPVALKRVQFASDSLPTLRSLRNKKGSKANQLPPSTSSSDRVKNERIYNDIFVPKRPSLDFTSYNLLTTIKANKKINVELSNSEQNLKSDSKSHFLRENSAGKAPVQKSYAFKEFKIQVLKKKFKEPNSFSSSISNIQKRYFSKSNHQPNHQLQYNSTQPFDHLNFYTQSMTLTGSSTANNNNGSSTARNLSKYPSFYSASESQLNKSPYLNSRSKQRIL